MTALLVLRVLREIMNISKVVCDALKLLFHYGHIPCSSKDFVCPKILLVIPMLELKQYHIILVMELIQSDRSMRKITRLSYFY